MFLKIKIDQLTNKNMVLLYTAGVNFINVFCAHFSYKILAPKITKLGFGFESFGAKISYKKCEHKTLMKLTPGISNSRHQHIGFLYPKRHLPDAVKIFPIHFIILSNFL